MARREWTEEEKQFIIESRVTMSCAEMAKKLNRTVSSIHNVSRRLGLNRQQKVKIGDKIGRFTVKKIYIKQFNGYKKMVALCECECGKSEYKEVTLNSLRTGGTQSCGCLQAEKARRTLQSLHTKLGSENHGLSRSRIYKIYRQMISRCTNKKHWSYKSYGGRGISVCQEWLDSFQDFYDWSMDNGYNENLTIDRIQNDFGYCPENCRWVTIKIQANNTRANHMLTAFGETKTMMEWSEDPRCNVSYGTLSMRINKLDWNIEESIATPPRKKQSPA